MKGTCWWVAAAWLSGCGAPGVLSYNSGVPKGFRAEFAAADGCSAKSHLRIPAALTKFYLIDGRESYAWLGVNQKYRGLEIEAYYRDEKGHHFSFRERRRAWQYHIPDEVGANGIMEYFEDNKLDLVAVDDGFRVVGHALAQCELTYVGAEGHPLSAKHEPATPPPCASPDPAAPTPTVVAPDAPEAFPSIDLGQESTP
jgi:hypothetical protein